mmetsp:Transcript_14693/g.33745  ORF Transcript_14693/g.33745 Transcript_14693/m.33745 type:complete len:88 (+) Transcript_14693:38-301(+)
MAEVLLILGAVHIGALVVAINAPGGDFKWASQQQQQAAEEVREEVKDTDTGSYFAEPMVPRETVPAPKKTEEPKSVPLSSTMPKIIV